MSTDPDKLQERREKLLDHRSYWARKWIDYLAIGNGAALVACSSAILSASKGHDRLILPAWMFLAGVVTAALIAFFRTRLLYTLYREHIDGRAWLTNTFRIAVGFCELASSGLFIAGISIGLLRS